MQLKLSCHQCKTDCKVVYVSLMVTTKQKPTVDTQRIKKRELNHTTMENHQFTKEDREKKGTREVQHSQKTIIWHCKHLSINNYSKYK